MDQLLKNTIRIKIIPLISIVFIIFICFSCKLRDNGIIFNSPSNTKNVHYVASLISSTIESNPVITYVDPNRGTVQLSQLSLDVTVKLAVGAKAVLTGTCNGFYNASVGQSSAIVDLRIYVNDTLQAKANDIETDSLSSVTAAAQCSCTIK